jgi:hypothetical protein
VYKREIKDPKDLQSFRLKAEYNKQVIRVLKVKGFPLNNQVTTGKVQEFKEEEKDFTVQDNKFQKQ